MKSTFQKPDTFWRELIDNHVLSPELVEEHRVASMKLPRTPLGKILIREGYLTVRQVMGLVSMQATEPHLRLGDLAVREGVCSPRQIAHCLELQARYSPGPIKVLLQDERVSSDKLVHALVSYIHHLEGRVVGLTEREGEPQRVGA
ncbi:MAG: hypothetical protein GY871_17695 [Actinomycetales bacterium]|nr:hypothetical protein [Actinomycetales bacterium]